MHILQYRVPNSRGFTFQILLAVDPETETLGPKPENLKPKL